jgi:hypothetical protein
MDEKGKTKSKERGAARGENAHSIGDMAALHQQKNRSK